MADIEGTPGVDNNLSGTGDADTISGKGGNDTIKGKGGDDTISGANGHDTLDGGAGDDTVDGGNGSDTLYGRNGHDDLEGGNGDDFLDGGNGHDRLYGGRDTDQLTGGNGNDTFVIDGSLVGLSLDTITDFDFGRDLRSMSFTDEIELFNVGGLDVDFAQNGDDVELYISGTLMAVIYGSEGALLAEDVLASTTVVGADALSLGLL